MSKMIQIRNVPDDVHRTLKVRAAQMRKSLSEFLLDELTGIAERPTLDELIARIQQRRPAKPRINSAAAVRAERDARR